MLNAEHNVNRKLRAVIIGCGRVAGGYDEEAAPEIINTHVKAYQQQPGTELIAVADLDMQKARKFAARWGIPVAYSDTEKMLKNEKPDIVSICTPDETHSQMLQMCLGLPEIKAVWSEKPLATDLGKAEEIVRAYVQRGVVLAVNYSRRWDDKFNRIKIAIQREELGTIQKVVVYYTKGVCHNGSHAVDLFLDWFGKVSEMQVFASHIDFIPDDPTVDARLLFGSIPVYLLGVDEREYTIFEIHILGTSGRVNVKSDGQVEWFKRQPDSEFKGYQKLDLCGTHCMTSDVEPMAVALQELVRAALNNGTVRSNGESALATLRICRQLAIRALERF